MTKHKTTVSTAAKYLLNSLVTNEFSNSGNIVKEIKMKGGGTPLPRARNPK